MNVEPNGATTFPEALIYVLAQYPSLSQTFVRNEIHGLRRAGVHVDILSIGPADVAHIDIGWPGEFRTLRLPSYRRALRDHIWFLAHRPGSYWRYLLALGRARECWRLALRRMPTEARQLWAERRAAGCHTHFAWPTASVAVYLARLLNMPATITVHANDIYVGDKGRLRARLKQFERVVTVCHFNAGLLTGLGVLPVGDGVDVVPCGVPVPADPPRVSRRHSVEIVSVGRLVEKKGFDTLVRAVALVRQDLPDVHVTIVGEGPERVSLTKLVAELGVETNVTLVGAMSHDATLEFIASAKVFCLASQRARDGDCDALPVVVREAMARRVPVISTRVAGIPETVDDAVGWLVEPGSPRELAEAIRGSLTDAQERGRRGVAGRARVVERWTLDAQTQGMLRVFERSVNQGTRRGYSGG